MARLQAANYASRDERSRSAGSPYVSMVIDYTTEDALEHLRQQGAVIYATRSNMALLSMPREQLDSINVSGQGISRVSISIQAMPMLDKAKACTKVDVVNAGSVACRPYTGKGVLLGFSDTGFDANHPAFESGIVGFTHINDTAAVVIRATSPAEICAMGTDTPGQTHATHVGGIMVGHDSTVPYTGVAPSAQLFATTSPLYDAGILAGVEEIAAYAHRHDMPAVVNLSLGSIIGPRDGTDAFCRYLDLIAAEMPVVLSAGNSGDLRCTAAKDLKGHNDVMSLLVGSTDWSDIMHFHGYADFWSDSSHTLEARLRIWDVVDNKLVWTGDWTDFANYPDAMFSLGETEQDDFSKYFDGRVLAVAEICPDNNRYNLLLAVDAKSLVYEQSWSRLQFAIDIKSSSASTVDAAVSNSLSIAPSYYEDKGFTAGSAASSISSMACGKNTIAVGSYSSRDMLTLLDGTEKDWRTFCPAGTPSPFSSYGHTFTGEVRPHLCAPGAFVVSAMSTPYMETHDNAASQLVCRSVADPAQGYFAECGTSMASPHAAAVFALWLEADPTLTPGELRQIAMATARRTSSPDDPRWGAGLIDAKAGLDYILGRNSITGTASAQHTARREGNAVICHSPCRTISAFTPDGRVVDPNALPPTPVIVRIEFADGSSFNAIL